MKFKIKLDDPGFHAEVTLDGYKTLNGDFLFDKHPEMDILINKKTSKVITFPKKDFGTEAYESQDRFLSFLVNKGIMDRSTIRSGNVANSLLGELLEPKEATMDNISICMLEIYNFLKKE